MVIKSRRLGWAGHVAIMEKGRSVFKMLPSKYTENRHLRRTIHSWEDNIIMDLKEIGLYEELG